MKSYESSAATLRAVLAHPFLRREKIDETMEAIASANANAQEIDELIRIGGEIAQGVTTDDSDLEAELQGLVADAEIELEREKAREHQDMLKSSRLNVPLHALQASEEAWTDNEMDEEYRHAKESRLHA